ncbi:MAG: hypothetical protein GOVbin2066_4 [Prokaryotic dsDNA virus sp.]|nr:MAG: hypothetical protein GOVbin2066_4 [Prokaryotic dsDNA virus sp.]|tara:strand:+ start:803 stop:976 length:174 start_codon:yes stop_codon:yes gene_type:complete
MRDDLCPVCKKIIDDYIEANATSVDDFSDLYARLNRVQDEINSIMDQISRASINELI